MAITTHGDGRTDAADKTLTGAQLAEAPGSASLEHLCATILMGRDWHTLSTNEREIVRRLENSGHLTKRSDGFVGWMPNR